ncbi:MAG TPA: methyltransferase [Planctomycetota bacterium]|nr:methyltransferase [Planctomycetota bacterium]
MESMAPILRADAHVHRLYADYSGLPFGVVTECAQRSDTLTQAVWQQCEGDSWRDKARVFYERYEEAMFDLLRHDTSRAQRRSDYEKDGIWSWLAGAGASVLDFGGGLGLTSSLMCEIGKQVTYCEVDGPALRFARWYFEGNGQRDIEVVRTPSATPQLPLDRRWDLVLVESVLEHVADPVATIENLASVVSSGGLLYLAIARTEAACPLRQPVAVADLMTGSAALRAMERVLETSDGRCVFRAA